LQPIIDGDCAALPAVAPGPGEAVEIVPGVYWFSTWLPYRLRAINQWLLQDGDGWTMIDCGVALPEVRRQIEAVWASVLKGKPITRLVITHHHIDHLANCRWICDEWGIVPSATQAEYKRAQTILSDAWDREWDQRMDFWQKHGLTETQARNINDAWDADRELFAPLPQEWNCLRDGDSIQIGVNSWQVLTCRGHAPEQALLYSAACRVLISGDQVLPKITPNVSVFDDEPDAEPLTLFLRSNRRIARTCADGVVLPSHNLPFRGLQARIRELEQHHQHRLALIEGELKHKPHTAAALLPVLFDQLTGHELGFAVGEIVAHLHHVVVQGRAEAMERDGKILFAAK
jgi:glyoxylase-like metal-dependent hydrolase (beta-lactamase superfamily II)